MNDLNNKFENEASEKYNCFSQKIYKFGFFGMLFASVCVAVLYGNVSFSENIFANTGVPGSDSDPLVSKSYVDQQIEKYLGEIESQVVESASISLSDRTDIVNDVVSQIQDTYAYDGNTISATAYVPVKVSKGETIVGGEGTEMILRSGNANANCPGEDAIVDITTGLELWNDKSIERNHMILIPREDGRGVKVTETAWFMIKGKYTIK